MNNAIEVNAFLHRLKISQLQTLIDRYQLKIVHITSFRKRNDMEKTLEKYMKTNGIGDCPICFEPNKFMTAVATSCSHIFCDKCLIEHLKKNHMCPMCREPVDMLFILNQISVHRLFKLKSIAKDVIIENPIIDIVPLEHIINEPVERPDVLVGLYAICYSYSRASFITMCVCINICITIIVIYEIYMIVYNKFSFRLNDNPL